MTHKQYQQTYNLNQRTAANRIKLVCGCGFSSEQEIPTDQLAVLLERFSKEKAPQKTVNKGVQIAVKNTPQKAQEFEILHVPKQPQKAPAKTAIETAQKSEREILFFAPLAVNVLSIALTVAGLKLFMGLYGVALGVMFGLMLFSAVVVSRNNSKGDTSQTAINTVLYMELGACMLHPFTFYSKLPNGINNYLAIGAACIAASFVAVLSYNAVLIVRNYNAEN